MNHAHVARVYDAGETPRGRPYFAMEYVKGSPITDYCDRERLTTRERLELMIQVCDGVQHAHQKGVIHRDLKPSNILVGVEDSRAPTPKIIDFGVAKATNQHLTEMTLMTEMGQLIGTPEYMSPEQAEMTGQDVDTRTDVYALGVVLYELLTGTLPFESKDLRQAGILEVQRRIRDVDPPRPSTRVSSLGEDSTNVAERRRTMGPALVRNLRGDLDWIVMRALEKDRLRRYGSPSEFAADLQRHLNDEPVLAASPSVGYRARKFVKRHRTGVIAAAMFVVALLIGVAGLASGLVRARTAEQQAVVALEQATQSSEELGEVVDFMLELFEVTSPEDGSGQDLTAREILDRGAKRLRTDLRDRPRTRAELLGTVGGLYQKIALYDRAAEYMNDRLEILRSEYGESSREVAEALLELAGLEQDRANFAAAETAAQSALEILRQHHTGDHIDVADALHAVALSLTRAGNSTAADAPSREALNMVRRLPDVDPATLESHVRIRATILSDNGEYDRETEALYLESLALCREIHEGDHAYVAYAIDNLAIYYDQSERLDEAEPLYREALAMLRRVYDGDHPEVAQTMGNVAGFLAYEAELSEGGADDLLDESESLYRAAIAMHRTYRPGHPMIADGLNGLSYVESLRGNYADAAALSEQAIEIYEKKLEPGHPKLVDGQLSLAYAWLDDGRGEDALEFLGSVLATFDTSTNADARHSILAALVEVCDATGRDAEAARYRARLPEGYLTEEAEE